MARLRPKKTKPKTPFYRLTRKIACNFSLKQIIAESGLLALVNTSPLVMSNETDTLAGFPVRTRFQN